MAKVFYRIHFKSGLSIDVQEETEQTTYVDVFKELLNNTQNTQVNAKTYSFRNGTDGEKVYVFCVNDIVCIETIKNKR